MQFRFTHLSGANAQHVDTAEACPILLGRDDKCHVRFDKFKELSVSGQHAQIDEVREGEYCITTLSKNGLLVNGRIVDGAVALPNHSTIQLGKDGPRIRFDVDVGVGGISRLDVQRKTGKLLRSDIGKKAPTTEERPVYVPPEVAKADAPDRSPALIIAVVGVVLVLVAVIGYVVVALR